MKKLVVLLLCLLFLPVVGLAEAEIPVGYRVEDFVDFALPVPPNALVTKYDKDIDDGFVADIRYLDLTCEKFASRIWISWMPNNMSAYLKGAHPLQYAKQLAKDVRKMMEEDGISVSLSEAIWGKKTGDAFTSLVHFQIEADGWFSSKPHDLWMVQRFYGTYDMGTYCFEAFAESRERVETILLDFDRIVYSE